MWLPWNMEHICFSAVVSSPHDLMLLTQSTSRSSLHWHSSGWSGRKSLIHGRDKPVLSSSPWSSLQHPVAVAPPVSSVHPLPLTFPSVSDCFFSVPFEVFLFFTGLCMLKVTDSQSYHFPFPWPCSSYIVKPYLHKRQFFCIPNSGLPWTLELGY